MITETVDPSSNEVRGLALLNRITERSKGRYDERLAHIRKNRIVHGKEDWNEFNSGVKEHFAERSLWTTFHGIGGYDEQSIKAEMKKRREALHADGRKMMIVEHFGQGRAGKELGADKVLISGLTTFSGAPEEDQVVGDALDTENEMKLVEKISAAKNQGHSLQAVFFRPVGGMSLNSINVYAFRRLYEQLRTAYELLDDDGMLFIGSFGTGEDIQLLQSMLEVTGCRELVMVGAKKNAIGIQKRKSVRSSLPSETEWALAQPDILRKLIELDERDSRIRA